MKITVYTITNCPFSQKEKEYLKQHNLPFEEKNLEEKKEWLEEMLAVSNNFAGTPVTKIEKDDGTTIVLKGFTPEEFDKVLQSKPTESEEKATPQPPTPAPVQQSTPKPETKAEVSSSPVEATQAASVVEKKSTAEETVTPPPAPAPTPSQSSSSQNQTQTTAEPQAPQEEIPQVSPPLATNQPAPTENAQPSQTPATAPKQDDQMDELLSKIREKAEETEKPGSSTPQSPSTTQSTPPSGATAPDIDIPDFNN